MVFNSFHFFYFFVVVFLAYWASPWRVQNVLLLAASYYFYGSWDPRFLGLLLLSTVIDFTSGIVVERAQKPSVRKIWLLVSMVANLGMLGFFKYYNFFIENFDLLLKTYQIHVPIYELQLVLPIGISFYTFQSMSYVIDVYRKEIPATRNFVQFAAFVSFFPHLVAGPIMRPTTLLPQIQQKRRFDLQQFYGGSYLIFWGLFKKMVIADNLSTVIVDPIFHDWSSASGGECLLAIYAFAFQIYCDFSGYTDVARGVAKCLGFELCLNFNLPYFSRNCQEFWTRWHISLSQWLRDYLYIPLGGSRPVVSPLGGNLLLIGILLVIFLLPGYVAVDSGSISVGAMGPWALKAVMTGVFVAVAAGVLLIRSPALTTSRNLYLTMVIGGLWHGAAWTFLLWGMYHGLLLIANRLKPSFLKWKPTGDRVRDFGRAMVQIVVTFHLVCLGWLFFRAESLEQIGGMLSKIGHGLTLPTAGHLALFLALAVPLMLYEAAQYAAKEELFVFRLPWLVRSVVYSAIFYAIVLGAEFGGGQFIYFQF